MSERDETKDTGGPLEPLPCPWCGDAPQCTRVRVTGPLQWGLGCMNGACPIIASIDAPTEAEAIAAWNTRRTPASSRERALLGEMAWALRLACDLTDSWIRNAEDEGTPHADLEPNRAQVAGWRALLARYDAATKETADGR